MASTGVPVAFDSQHASRLQAADRHRRRCQRLVQVRKQHRKFAERLRSASQSAMDEEVAAEVARMKVRTSCHHVPSAGVWACVVLLRGCHSLVTVRCRVQAQFDKCKADRVSTLREMHASSLVLIGSAHRDAAATMHDTIATAAQQAVAWQDSAHRAVARHDTATTAARQQRYTQELPQRQALRRLDTTQALGTEQRLAAQRFAAKRQARLAEERRAAAAAVEAAADDEVTLRLAKRLPGGGAAHGDLVPRVVRHAVTRHAAPTPSQPSAADLAVQHAAHLRRVRVEAGHKERALAKRAAHRGTRAARTVLDGRAVEALEAGLAQLDAADRARRNQRFRAVAGGLPRLGQDDEDRNEVVYGSALIVKQEEATQRRLNAAFERAFVGQAFPPQLMGLIPDATGGEDGGDGDGDGAGAGGAGGAGGDAVGGDATGGAADFSGIPMLEDGSNATAQSAVTNGETRDVQWTPPRDGRDGGGVHRRPRTSTSSSGTRSGSGSGTATTSNGTGTGTGTGTSHDSHSRPSHTTTGSSSAYRSSSGSGTGTGTGTGSGSGTRTGTGTGTGTTSGSRSHSDGAFMSGSTPDGHGLVAPVPPPRPGDSFTSTPPGSRSRSRSRSASFSSSGSCSSSSSRLSYYSSSSSSVGSAASDDGHRRGRGRGSGGDDDGVSHPSQLTVYPLSLASSTSSLESRGMHHAAQVLAAVGGIVEEVLSSSQLANYPLPDTPDRAPAPTAVPLPPTPTPHGSIAHDGDHRQGSGSGSGGSGGSGSGQVAGAAARSAGHHADGVSGQRPAAVAPPAVPAAATAPQPPPHDAAGAPAGGAAGQRSRMGSFAQGSAWLDDGSTLTEGLHEFLSEIRDLECVRTAVAC